MNATRLIDRLDAFRTALPALVAKVRDDDARWKPPSGAWSILEIVCHLVDEEVEDFRTRLRLTLDDPQAPWPSIDPEAAALTRRYLDRELQPQVSKWVDERAASVAWLRSLREPVWDRAYQHPRWGPISAGMLLGAWAAHDMLHLRQIAKRQHELAGRDASPYPTGYAGPWGA